MLGRLCFSEDGYRDEVILALIHVRGAFRPEFQAPNCQIRPENHPPFLDVSHRPRRHLVLSPRPSNLMGVRVHGHRSARHYLTYLLQSRCRRSDGPHPNDTRPSGHNTVVHAT